MTKNYIQYRTMKSATKNKIILFMDLNYRCLSHLHADKIKLDHFDKNNNTLWLYSDDNKVLNTFNLTDYEVEKISDDDKFIKYRNYRNLS